MVVNIDRTGTVKGLERLIDETISVDGVRSLIILACGSNEFVPENIDKILKKIQIPLTGGIFVALIYKNEKIDKGSIVIGVSEELNFITIPFLSSDDADYEALLGENISVDDDFKTMFIFVDGYSKRISAFIDSLYNVIGSDTNYLGGGAGSLSFKQSPCLFTNNGLVADCAVVCGLHMKSSIGVSHGWKPVSIPYKTTESEGNILKSLDWKPAFEIYQEFVQQYSNRSIARDDFYSLAKLFPFGISRLDSEWLVRDPISVLNDNSIVCVGEVTEGSHVHILTADNSSLIKAAENALLSSKENLSTSFNKQIRIIIDCVSRVFFLGENFIKEIETVCEGDISIIGICTLGELANGGNRYLEFYNKTIVVVTLEK